MTKERSSERRHKQQRDGHKGTKAHKKREKLVAVEEELAVPVKPRFYLPDHALEAQGLNRDMLDESSWLTLRRWCKRTGLSQAQLEAFYERFKSTLLREEHSDFTRKKQFHASLDFVQDELYSTGGEFAWQLMLQTWFQRPCAGLYVPVDRRQFDFARLVIQCGELCAMGDIELLITFCACITQRYHDGDLQAVLSTRLNSELARCAIAATHSAVTRQLCLLLDDLCKPGTLLSVRDIVRYAVLHPALLFPAVQLQRTLQRRMCGCAHWRSLRKPAADRSASVTELLALPAEYDDLFSRVHTVKDAWRVTTGSLLVRAATPDESTAGYSAVQQAQRQAQLVRSAVLPAWYTAAAAAGVALSKTARLRRATKIFRMQSFSSSIPSFAALTAAADSDGDAGVCTIDTAAPAMPDSSDSDSSSSDDGRTANTKKQQQQKQHKQHKQRRTRVQHAPATAAIAAMPGGKARCALCLVRSSYNVLCRR
jgi:hypothetical protein